MEPALTQAACRSIAITLGWVLQSACLGIEGASDSASVLYSSLTAASRAVKREPVPREDFLRYRLDCEPAEHLSPLASLAGLGRRDRCLWPTT